MPSSLPMLPIKEQCLVQNELAAAVGKEKRTYCHEVNDEELAERYLG